MANNRYTKEMLAPLVANAKNWAEVCRKVGIAPRSGSQTNLKKRAVIFGIDFSHFLGKGSNKGRKFGPKRPLEHYLVKNSSMGSHKLRLRLIKEGVKAARCEKCVRTKWLSEDIPLELHHLNGDHWDNRLENLQILCPNCHSVT